jgi:hypothetical protein
VGFLLIETDEALQLQRTLKDSLAPRESALFIFGKIMQKNGFIEALNAFTMREPFDYVSLFESKRSWVQRILDDKLGNLFEVCYIL